MTQGRYLQGGELADIACSVLRGDNRVAESRDRHRVGTFESAEAQHRSIGYGRISKPGLRCPVVRRILFLERIEPHSSLTA